MLNLFKPINNNKPKLRELDPVTIQRVKEGAYLVKLIGESQVAARKCEYYSGIATDNEIIGVFQDEASRLKKYSHAMQEYYESMTME